MVLAELPLVVLYKTADCEKLFRIEMGRRNRMERKHDKQLDNSEDRGPAVGDFHAAPVLTLFQCIVLFRPLPVLS